MATDCDDTGSLEDQVAVVYGGQVFGTGTGRREECSETDQKCMSLVAISLNAGVRDYGHQYTESVGSEMFVRATDVLSDADNPMNQNTPNSQGRSPWAI